MPSTPAKVEGCPSRCRHPSSAFLRKLSPVGSAQKRANLKPPIARQLFYQMYCQTDRNGDTGQQQIKKKPKKYKTRETCQLKSSGRAVLHISKCTVKTISLSMPKINLQTQHRHPQNTFIAILLQFWLCSSDFFCKSFQLLIFASFVPYGIKFLRKEI